MSKNNEIKIFLGFGFLTSTITLAQTQCFLAQENNKIIKQEGDSKARYSPCSTFKIPLSLIGYDAEILTDETHPVWPFKEGYDAFRDAWRQNQTPQSWIKESCVWYSQVLTQQLGIEKFQNYVTKLNYGNKDLSGDAGKHNGLTQAWLSSSLEISPQEQLEFLQKLRDNALPVSEHAHTMTKSILFVEELPSGWKLYGKTGSGYLLNEAKTQKSEIRHGWFIGWIEKNNRKIIFVHHIVDDQKEETHAGPRAKKEAKEKLLQMIDSMEKG